MYYIGPPSTAIEQTVTTKMLRITSVRLMLVFLCLVAVSGCRMMQVKREIDTFYVLGALLGNVTSESSSSKPIMVVAMSENEGVKEVASFQVLNEPGPYALLVAEGEYYIYAFEDANENLVADAHEYFGSFGNSEKVTSKHGRPLENLNIELKRGSQHAQIDLNHSIDKMSIDLGTEAWKMGDLDDELFSEEYGDMGLWRPLEFLQKAGSHIYFLEKYDERKIPILFVHGAGGSPAAWEYFVDHIDRSRYQPWLIHYPSGVSLMSAARLLSKRIADIHSELGFEQLYITAHSMGGLVVRASLVQEESRVLHQCVRLFISISTPWGGHRAAGLGVKYSPIVVPSWRDMVPNSEFNKKIFSTELSPNIRHHLFFSFKGDRKPLRPNNDKTVTIASELDYRAQREAVRIYGFNEDHISILDSEEVISQYNEILKNAEENDVR